MEGYAKVAHLMARQKETAILRRFRKLNLQRLLYLQAEITHLEYEVKQLAERDSAHEDRIYHAKDWWSLSQAGEREDTEQWRVFSELSGKLDLYNDLLLKQVSLAKLEQPRKYDLEFLRDWFQRPSMGSFPLLGVDRDSWDTKNENDLIAIKPRSPQDLFSEWFTEKLVPRYHGCLGRTLKEPIAEEVGSGIYNYEESALDSLLGILVTVVASLLPICSVVALYLITSNGLRLGMIAIFSACFALALALMTNARRIEVFAATAAFAAVNAVFLTNGQECSCSV